MTLLKIKSSFAHSGAAVGQTKKWSNFGDKKEQNGQFLEK